MCPVVAPLGHAAPQTPDLCASDPCALDKTRTAAAGNLCDGPMSIAFTEETWPSNGKRDRGLRLTFSGLTICPGCYIAGSADGEAVMISFTDQELANRCASSFCKLTDVQAEVHPGQRSLSERLATLSRLLCAPGCASARRTGLARRTTVPS